MLKWILGFLLGCCSIFWLSEPLSVFGWISTITLFAFLLAVTGRFGDKSPIFQAINRCLMGFCIGLLWLQVHSELRLQQRITEPLTQAHIIKAKLLSIPQVYDGLLQFKVKVLDSDSQILIGKRLKLSWYRASIEANAEQPLPKLGQTWQFSVTVKPIVAALNNAGYDSEKQSFLEHIAGKGTIKAATAIKLINASGYSIDNVRQSLFEKLQPFSHSGLLQALIIGEKSAISPEQRLTIQALGISHLLAISGLHISIVAGLFFWLGTKTIVVFNRFGWVSPPLLGAAIISLIAALIYSALAGFSVATLRAFIMWAVFVFAIVSSNNKAIFRSLAIALLVILVIDPVTVLSYGFWLTFAAIAIIGAVLLGRTLNNSKSKLAIKTQWTISLGMALLVLLLFQQISLIAFIVNLILIPLFSLIILPLIFLALISVLLINSTMLMELVDKGFAVFFHSFNANIIKDSGLFLQAYVGQWAYLLLLTAFIFYLLPIGRLKYLAASALLLAALTIEKFPQQKLDYNLVIFDVGHGLANLIYNDQVAVLYDTGFANEGFSYAESSLIPSLRKLGIKKLDLLVVSHKDLDHSGGAMAIKAAFDIRGEIDSSSCINQQTIDFTGLKLKLYSVQDELSFSSNNQSCVVKATVNSKTILLTGDIEKETEYKLLKKKGLY